MKRLSRSKMLPFLIVVLLLVAGCEKIELSAQNPVDGWAILAEKDDYTGLNMENLLVDYIDMSRMHTALENSGWNPDHIHVLAVSPERDPTFPRVIVDDAIGEPLHMRLDAYR